MALSAACCCLFTSRPSANAAGRWRAAPRETENARVRGESRWRAVLIARARARPTRHTHKHTLALTAASKARIESQRSFGLFVGRLVGDGLVIIGFEPSGPAQQHAPSRMYIAPNAHVSTAPTFASSVKGASSFHVSMPMYTRNPPLAMNERRQRPADRGAGDRGHMQLDDDHEHGHERCESTPHVRDDRQAALSDHVAVRRADYQTRENGADAHGHDGVSRDFASLRG